MLNQDTKQTSLFEYLEEKQNQEFLLNNFKSKNSNIRNIYLTNFVLFFSVIITISLLFFVQFKVDNVQSRIDLVQDKINDYHSELKLLDVEWHYLTRPSRLRYLSQKYLSKNDSIASNQVKKYDELEDFYLVRLKQNETYQISSK